MKYGAICYYLPIDIELRFIMWETEYILMIDCFFVADINLDIINVTYIYFSSLIYSIRDIICNKDIMLYVYIIL